MNGRQRAILFAILAAGAALRLFALDRIPLGLNQDESINAWNAFCLLRTGRDMTGAAWPIFHSHCIGDERTTLFFYLLLPFQAIFGLSALSTRLPAALTGTLCIALIAYVGGRIASARSGLIAAALLAFDPWHLFVSRLGLEGGVTPFLGLVPLAAFLASRLGTRERARTGWAIVAGASAGIACYGYWPVRLWMPAAALLGFALLGRDGLRRIREQRMAAGALLASAAITFGPLLWRHLTDPLIAHRAEQTRLWSPDASPLAIVVAVAQRWALHFGPRFLFVSGDSNLAFQSPAGGAMAWIVAPLLSAGVVAVARDARHSVRARGLAALVLAYPAGDLVAAYDGVHALRSAIGIPALVLLAAYGADAVWRSMQRVAIGPRRTLAAVALLAAIASVAVPMRAYFNGWATRPVVYHGFEADLNEAAEWLAPRWRPGDKLLCTTTSLNSPWAAFLVHVHRDPARWFREPRLCVPSTDGWDLYPRIGDMWFLFRNVPSVRADIERMQHDVAPQHLWLILRPGEMQQNSPVHVITRPDGQAVLWICEGTI